MKKLSLLLLLVVILGSTVSAQYQKITYRLQEKLNSVDRSDYVKALVIYDNQVDLQAMDDQFYAENATIERRTEEVISTLRKVATSSQAELIQYLKAKSATDDVFEYRPFWIVNMVAVEARASVIEEMASRSDISKIDLDAKLEWDKPVSRTVAPDKATSSVEDGLKIINADKLWAMGLTGAGRIVMNIDTGVDYTHPALASKWRGTHVPAEQAWYGYDGGTTPTDCDGHGTHTMGTMAGYTDTDTVGVAIGAEWIAANTLCAGSPHTSYSVGAFEWAMNPDGDSTTIDDMPDAISNSWYDPAISDECDNIYAQTLLAVEAVGIAAVFSAGNSGPGASTITTPKNLAMNEVNSWATGALDGAAYLNGAANPIASFSSRGPGLCGEDGTSLKIKPEASAPGVDVRSAYPGGGYSLLSGTSMASPHVAGAIALLREFVPQLTGKQIKEALYNTAQDLGEAGEDNTFGTGLIDVYAAFLSLGTPDDVPPTQIVDLAIGDVTSNSIEIIWSAPLDTAMSGVASYDIRYSTSAINDTNDFYAANVLTYNAKPDSAGNAESAVLGNINPAETYYFAIISVDLWGNKSEMSNVAIGTSYDPPVAAVTPNSLSAVVAPGQSHTETLNIANTSATNSTLNFNVTLENNTFPTDAVKVSVIPSQASASTEQVGTKESPAELNGFAIEGAGGPDNFGYEWIDSNEPNGPAYEWNDISTTGTPVTNWSPTGTYNALDEGYATVDLGFNFKFYGNEYSTVYLSSNGFISMAALTANSFTNNELPSTGEPQGGMIAAFWDDLEGDNGGAVYYQNMGDKGVIQYTDWHKYNNDDQDFTVQIHLFRSGKVMIYYNDVPDGNVSSLTVGMENEDASDGFSAVYNAAFLEDNMAVKFSADPDWLVPDTFSGMLYNGNDLDINVQFLAEDYPEGEYSMDVVIATNDPNNPTVTVPVMMSLGESANNWEAVVTLMEGTDSKADQELTIGQYVGATDGIDSEFGEYELPPNPPAGVFYAAMKLPDGTTMVNKDFRSMAVDMADWNIEVSPTADTYPMILSWDPTDLPDGMFVLMDAATSGDLIYVNMKAQNSYEVTNSGITALTVHYEELNSVNMTMHSDWNIVSAPLSTFDMSVDALFPDATSPAYMFNGGYTPVTELSPGQGYWLKFDSESQVSMSGSPVAMDIDLAAGWNMIGGTEMSVPVANIVTDPAGIITTPFYGYNEGYATSETLEPGHGYWVKVSEAGSASLGTPGKKGVSNNTMADEIDAMNKLVVTDATGKSRTLYFGDSFTAESFELPPVPFASAFDVRYSDNSSAADISALSTVKLQGATYPITVSVTGTDVTLKGANENTIILKDGNKTALNSSSFSVQLATIPENFNLSQNYPNPFNPSTNITFALPVESKVNITIYNILGQKVMDVVNTNMQAGTHELKLSLTHLASGMYIYSLQAEGVNGKTFADNKKMMLMK